MNFYPLTGYGYMPALSYDTRPSFALDEQPVPKVRRLSTRVGNKVRRLSQMNSSERAGNEYGQKQRLLLRLASWLNPRRWIHAKVKRAARSPGAPVIPPINMGETLFLESLVRHTEDGSFGQPRSSTLPLLHRPSDTPTVESFYGGSMPPGIVPTIVFESVVHPIHEWQRQPSTTNQRSEQASLPRANSNMLLLRSPHPPSSYQGVPLGIIHSRQSSQSACSTATSCYDPRDYRIGSLSESILSGTTSPLFYRPNRDSLPTTPPSTIPNEQSIRRKSTRISSLPDVPAPRAGSLTVSIRTEEGMEDLEFPSPPRWSGCWFSDRTNNQTPMPPNMPSSTEGESEDEEYGQYGENDRGTGRLPHAPLGSQESLTGSITESGASTSSSFRSPIPHKRTFGPHATSFLSLKARYRSTPLQAGSKSPVDMSSIDSEDHESGMDSVCSAFADVSLSSGAAFDGGHALSDTGSFADPSFLRSYT